jgi:hypothetical protein
MKTNSVVFTLFMLQWDFVGYQKWVLREVERIQIQLNIERGNNTSTVHGTLQAVKSSLSPNSERDSVNA